MAKVYESRSPHRGLYGQHFRVKFMPDASTVTKANPAGYGMVSSDNRTLILHANLKDDKGKALSVDAAIAEIEKLIEAEPEYQRNKLIKQGNQFGAGQLVGIWEKEWRVASEGRATVTSFRKSLADLGEPGLRKLIADNGGRAPAKATIDELVAIAFTSLAGPTAPIVVDSTVNSNVNIER